MDGGDHHHANINWTCLPHRLLRRGKAKIEILTLPSLYTLNMPLRSPHELQHPNALPRLQGDDTNYQQFLEAALRNMRVSYPHLHPEFVDEGGPTTLTRHPAHYQPGMFAEKPPEMDYQQAIQVAKYQQQLAQEYYNAQLLQGLRGYQQIMQQVPNYQLLAQPDYSIVQPQPQPQPQGMEMGWYQLPNNYQIPYYDFNTPQLQQLQEMGYQVNVEVPQQHPDNSLLLRQPHLSLHDNTFFSQPLSPIQEETVENNQNMSFPSGVYGFGQENLQVQGSEQAANIYTAQAQEVARNKLIAAQQALSGYYNNKEGNQVRQSFPYESFSKERLKGKKQVEPIGPRASSSNKEVIVGKGKQKMGEGEEDMEDFPSHLINMDDFM